MTVEQVSAAAATGLWIDQVAASAQSTTAASTTAAATAWQTFGAWYDAQAVSATATQVAALSLAGQQDVAGMFTEYIAQVTAALRGQARIPVPRVARPAVRNGADPVRVHSRPAEVFKQTFALTADDDLALTRSMERAMQIIETDLMLAARQAQQEAMDELGVTKYRRVLRPELSETGPCGLCVVAADRVYNIEELLPIHGRCRCIVLPVIDGQDLAPRLNRSDLKRLYEAAGSTQGADLKRIRVQVNEHGELGPVLSVRGQSFRGPDDLGDPVDRETNARQLAQLEDVMKTLMSRAADGEPMDAPLQYQRRQIARRRSIAAAN